MKKLSTSLNISNTNTVYSTNKQENMRTLISTFAILFLVSSGAAQENKVGNWMMYFGNVELSERWAIHGEVQYRNFNTIGDLEQLLLRTGIQYKFGNTPSRFTLGYGSITSEPYLSEGLKDKIHEHRIYQEFLTRQDWGNRINASHRYRLEQRFVDGNSDMKVRFRYALFITIPITNPEIIQNTIYAAVYNELFINGQGVVFDRNRLYGGVGYALRNNLRVQLGYMSQLYQDRQRGQVNISIHHNI